jgi:hypothetical protein
MFILFAAAIFAPRFIKDVKKRRRIPGGDIEDHVQNLGWVRLIVRVSCVALAIICFATTSLLWVGSDEVGHLKRIYLGRQMPPGRIIAMPDEMGPQARLLMPGFQFHPFIRVTHDIEMLSIMEVNPGNYAYLTAKDGNPMPDGQFIAPGWKSHEKMINGLEFMGWTGDRDTYERPKGVKGPQLTVLPPGKHRVNRYMFAAIEEPSTPIKTGFVGVIKSNVGADYIGDPILPTGIEASGLSVPIVPKGYRGVWAKVYTPGEYYINKHAYDVIPIDTRVQTWKYLGGYTRRIINLFIESDGKIVQEKDSIDVLKPDDAADKAVILRVEGWDIPQDSRVQVQVTPENAPFVVASVGGLVEIENKIITPNYRSIMRNAVAGDVTVKEIKIDPKTGEEILDDDGKPVMHTVTRRRKVLDLLYQRESLEKKVTDQLVPAGAKVGLTVQWVRFGDPAVPPELLIPGKRRQLAKQLELTYAQEKLAQVARVQSEKERARADQQPQLIKSEIGIKIAENKATAREKEGNGEKLFYTQLAEGQQAQADVLGRELTFQLALAKEILKAAGENPSIVKRPNVLVMGGGDGTAALTGAAAILGESNLTMGMMRPKIQLEVKQPQ